MCRLKIWDIESGACVSSMTHARGVVCMQNCGRERVVYSLADGTVHLAYEAEGDPLRRHLFDGTGALHCIKVFGNRMLAGGELGGVGKDRDAVAVAAIGVVHRAQREQVPEDAAILAIVGNANVAVLGSPDARLDPSSRHVPEGGRSRCGK